MGVLFGILIGLIAILLVLVLRSATTLVHELGHAIPALLFTDEEVIVFIGSYGDLNRSIHLRLGRLKLYFRLNLLDWKIGMCQHSGIQLIWQRMIVILGGPLASILLSIPLLIAIIKYQSSQMLLSILLIFFIAAVIDFFVNMIPISHPIQMHDGSISYNDGSQLLFLFRRMRASDIYLELEEQLYINKALDEVIEKGEAHLKDHPKERAIYELVCQAYLEKQDYQGALRTYQSIKDNFELKRVDYLRIGRVYMGMHQYDEAMKFFQHCYYKEFRDPILINDMAYINIQQGDYQQALKYLHAAISYTPDYFDAWLNQGVAYLRLENFDKAQNSFSQATILESNHPDLPFYQGQLYEEQGAYLQALEQYELAESRGCQHHGLAFRIESVKWRRR